jgi:ABC-2 type transport system permease protein
LAVYERSYKGYQGSLTPDWSRFLVLPRYTFRAVFKARLFLVSLIACFLVPLSMASWVYLSHNVQILEKVFGASIDGFLPVNADVFLGFMGVQIMPLGFVLVLIVAPQLISDDLANNALPLYLARPFSRTDYIIGKMSVLMILLSAITWVPHGLVFLLQAYFSGWQWFVDNIRIGIAIFVFSWIWILASSLIALALSALVRKRLVIRLSLFAVYVILSGFSMFLAFGLQLRWGLVLSLIITQQRLAEGLYGVSPEIPEFSFLSASIAILVFCAVSVYVLYRKIRAYEEVK